MTLLLSASHGKEIMGDECEEEGRREFKIMYKAR